MMSVAAGGVTQPPVEARKPPPVAPAVLVAALLLIITVISFLAVPAPPGDWLVSVLLCVLAALSGRWPVHAGAAIAVVSGIFVAATPQGSLAILACLVPIATCGMTGLLRERAWLTAIYGVVLTGWAWKDAAGHTPEDPWADAASSVAVMGALIMFAWMTGTALLREQQQQELAHREAIQNLRRDIARDLHDTVAHSMSLVTMRADQARLNGGASPEDLDFITTTSRQTIADLRTILFLLRPDQAGIPVGDTWTIEAPEGIITRKAEELRAAGFTVDLTVEGDLGVLARSVSGTLARVIHEALSNAHRHAEPGTQVTVLLTATEVEAQGAVFSVLPARARQATAPTMGIIGMRERVEGTGGRFTAGPRGGQWIVTASIPLHHGTRG